MIANPTDRVRLGSAEGLEIGAISGGVTGEDRNLATAVCKRLDRLVVGFESSVVFCFTLYCTCSSSSGDKVQETMCVRRDRFKGRMV